MARKPKKQSPDEMISSKEPAARGRDVCLGSPSEIVENMKSLLANSEAEIEYLLRLAKQRGVKISEKQLREIEELREMIERGPPPFPG